jgi:hypothetical protein
MCPQNNLDDEKLSFIIEGERKSFHNKQKLKEFMSTKPTLQKIPRGILYTEEEDNEENTGKNKPH